jgi:hypothetical protein
MSAFVIPCPVCGHQTAVPAQTIEGQRLPFVDTIVPQKVRTYVYCARCDKEVG